ncbi:MmcQ/YjbR family DNA-binding protein [Aquincola sp. S2]|uniref:MmcQ/YjbR family DNA-binding protein n=1 Tax=Pseudaquabacterium terrae TaxID=2732868 RepID=A0ABX2EFD8_9BURK|nr:MmcQ/YjbR family DNA-binding protein [Aquabacterium terrae]NRF67350.1 MmcQ/YjbR family DNA-binding protein [Aquabacterium terrae]
MTTHTLPAVPHEVLAKLRAICLALPEVVEESAWTGIRWSVRKKNFAHVLMIDGGEPAAYARAAGRAGPACVLTFRLPRGKLDAAGFHHDPYFRPVWFPNIAGRVVDERIDWDEVEQLLIDSYGVLAPKKLAAMVDR